MSSDEAVFEAELIGWRPLESRPYITIKLEVPIEHGDKMQSVLGWKRPGESIRVAVARLNNATATTKAE